MKDLSSKRALMRLAAGVAVLSCLLPGAAARAAGDADYPSHPIRLIVAYPPGGPVDIVGRAVAQVLSQELGGKSVVVDNRAGASGIVGTDVAAKAAPDGYTLLLGSSANSILQSLYTKLPYDAQRDLVMIGGIGSAPFVLVTGAKVPVTSVKELEALAKSEPGKLNYGSPGAGSPNHLSAELMKSMTGMDVMHVPYKGAAPAETDLMGGQLTFMFDTIPSALPLVASGKLRALAVTSAQRSPAAPNIPTLAEAGLAGFDTGTWYGLMGPAGMPPAIVKRLNEALNRGLARPAFVTRMASMGLQPMPDTPEQFTAFFAGEVGKWAKIVKLSGTHLEFGQEAASK